MKPSIKAFTTLIIAVNQLAGEYLAQLLARDGMATTIVCDSVPELDSRLNSIIFVVDSSLVPLCLPECVCRLQSRYPQARFIVVGRAQTKEESATLLRLGVHGIVEYRKVATTLLQAVCAVAQGRLWVSEEALQSYVQSTLQPRSQQMDKNVFRITRREAQVIELAKLRLSNREIADALGVQESTVKYHLSNIYDKLQVDNRRALEPDRQALRLWSQILSA